MGLRIPAPGLHALGARSDQEFLDGRDRHALDARPIESMRERIGRIDGFADQSHLSNVFREATGISPRRYRRAFAR